MAVQENKKHTVFLIVGRTASGKDRLVNAMCDQTKPNGEKYKQLLSYATRPKRSEDENTHTFISESEVEQYRDDIVAETKIGEYTYFATKSQLQDSDFYIIDYIGVENLRIRKLDDEFKFVVVYINVPNEIRRERALSSRKDNELVFNTRNENERFQFHIMAMKSDFDYSINNIAFDKSLAVLKSIVEIELGE